MVIKIYRSETTDDISDEDIIRHIKELKGRIDLSRKTGVLVRQSHHKADDNHPESRRMQLNLVEIAKLLRGEDHLDNIELYDEGSGVSGRKRIDQRPEFSRAYYDMKADKIGSLLVTREDRILRDKHMSQVALFTEVCEERRIRVIVPGKRDYDFRINDDLVAFQRKMQDAAQYIETHVRYMNEAKRQKEERGYWGGGRLPAPLVIPRETPKEYQRPVIYEPWLDQSIWVFKTFIDGGMNLLRLARKIEDLPHIFAYPPFEDVKKFIFAITMKQTATGYTIQRTRLTGYLTNLRLYGYTPIGTDEEGNIIVMPTHEAAIEKALFEPVYAFLTGHDLDGNPHEQGLQRKERYARKDPEGPYAILRPVITSDQGNVSPSHYKSSHRYCCYSGRTTHKVEHWYINCPALDQVVIDRLIAIAEVDSDLAEKVKRFYETKKQADSEELQLVTNAIAKTNDAIARIDGILQKQDLHPRTQDRYTKQLLDLEVQIDELEKKQARLSKSNGPDQKTIINLYEALKALPEGYDPLPLARKQETMELLIDSLVINELSPHVFKLDIQWLSPISIRPDTALLWRGKGSRNPATWTPEDDTYLKQHFLTGSQEELMSYFPDKSWVQIRFRGNELDMFRSRGGKMRKYPYNENAIMSDIEAIQQFADTSEDKEFIIRKMMYLADNTKPGELSAYWPIPADVLLINQIEDSTPVHMDNDCR